MWRVIYEFDNGEDFGRRAVLIKANDANAAKHKCLSRLNRSLQAYVVKVERI